MADPFITTYGTRHSFALSIPKESTWSADQLRPLTDDGVKRVTAFAAMHHFKTPNVIGSSPARRTIDTGAILWPVSDHNRDIVKMPELGIPDPKTSRMARILDKLYNQYGPNVPLKAYLLDQAYGQFIRRKGSIGWNAMQCIMDNIPGEIEDPVAAFMVHGTYGPAAFLAGIEPGPGPDNRHMRDMLYECNLAECETLVGIVDRGYFREVTKLAFV